MKKRDLFAELSEGFTALQQEREGKITQRPSRCIDSHDGNVPRYGRTGTVAAHGLKTSNAPDLGASYAELAGAAG